MKYLSACQSENFTSFKQSINLSCPNNSGIAVIKADFGRDSYSMSCDGTNLFHVLFYL